MTAVSVYTPLMELWPVWSIFSTYMRQKPQNFVMKGETYLVVVFLATKGGGVSIIINFYTFLEIPPIYVATKYGFSKEVSAM